MIANLAGKVLSAQCDEPVFVFCQHFPPLSWLIDMLQRAVAVVLGGVVGVSSSDWGSPGGC